MILLDTSAWIEFLRATGSPTHLRVKALLSEAEANIATTDVVSMELLAGARDAAHEQALQQAALYRYRRRGRGGVSPSAGHACRL